MEKPKCYEMHHVIITEGHKTEARLVILGQMSRLQHTSILRMAQPNISLKTGPAHGSTALTSNQNRNLAGQSQYRPNKT
jgi:hypothetical protein